MGNSVLIDLAEREFQHVCEPFGIVVTMVIEPRLQRTAFYFRKEWGGHLFQLSFAIPDEDKIIQKYNEQNYVDNLCMTVFRHMMFALKRRLR